MTGVLGPGRALVRAAGGLVRRPRTTALVIGAIAAGLLLVGLVELARVNVGAATARWGGGVHMVVYLEDGVPADRAERIRLALDQLPAVSRTEYVPPGQALDRLRESLGEHDQLVDDIEEGMLPGSIEVTLRDGVEDVAAAGPVMERLERTPGVDQVEFMGSWVDRMLALRRALDRAAWILLLLVGAAAAAAAAAALRLAAPARRDEEAALALLGAPRGFAGLPRVFEGVLAGVLGAAVAAAALWLLWYWLGPQVGAALGEAFGGDSPAFLGGSELGMLAAAGAVIGLLGGASAARRRLGA